MIKYIMRKTIYKNVDAQDILIQLNSPYFILVLFFSILYFFIYNIPLFLIDTYYNENIAYKLNLNIEFLELIYHLTFFLFTLLTFMIFEISPVPVAEKLYFLVWTRKGNALLKKDFKILKKKKKLYNRIWTQKCTKHSFSVCFKICKTLKKGSISFVLRQTATFDKIDVLYVNNGWVFDPYSCQQYTIEEFYQLFKAKEYKTFNFDEICTKSYSEFKKELKHELTEWAAANECSMF